MPWITWRLNNYRKKKKVKDDPLLRRNMIERCILSKKCLLIYKLLCCINKIFIKRYSELSHIFSRKMNIKVEPHPVKNWNHLPMIFEWWKWIFFWQTIYFVDWVLALTLYIILNLYIVFRRYHTKVRFVIFWVGSWRSRRGAAITFEQNKSKFKFLNIKFSQKY